MKFAVFAAGIDAGRERGQKVGAELAPGQRAAEVAVSPPQMGNSGVMPVPASFSSRYLRMSWRNKSPNTM